MLFTLEALKASYGDALLLHFGDPKAPNLAVIDGGPRGVYPSVLKPRLHQLMEHKRRLRDGQLPIRLLMVSHIDDDHVNGLLAMANELADTPGKPPFQVESLWHNSFDDLLGNQGQELAASLAPFVKSVLTTGTIPVTAPLKNPHAALVLASVKQGRDLRNAAKRLGWDINKEFGGKLVRLPQEGVRTVPIVEGMTLTPLGPREGHVAALQAAWDQELQRMGVAVEAVRAAEYADRSVFNLSSIVVLAEMPGTDGRPRRMLLTGDARGDHIIKGLESAGLMEHGTCHVDLLKLPHHGSDRNVEPAFFETVTADHYLVSSNGDKFDNPDKATLEWLAAARKGRGHFTLYLTYPVSEFKFKRRKTIRKEIQAFIDAGQKSGDYTVVCRAPTAPSVRVDLGEPLEVKG
jgi:hypothetical protein